MAKEKQVEKCDMAPVESGIETSIGKDGLRLMTYSSINPIREIWDELNTKGTMCSSAYLLALEKSCPEGIHPYYTVLFDDQKALGFIFYQVKKLNLAKALNVHTHSEKAWDKFVARFKQWALNFVRQDMLVIGNVLLTGQYSINFCKTVPKDERSKYLELAISGIQAFLNKQKGYNIKSILLKDFSPEEENNLYLSGYSRFTVDPAMSVDIRWDDFDQYLGDFKSKYRVRYKNTIKKGDGISLRSLDRNDLVEYKSIMFELYRQVSENVTFNLFNLKEDYFISLRDELGDKIIIKGLFYENKMTAFYTIIDCGEEYDAHFIGYDVQQNRQIKTYQNMLYFIVNDCIEAGIKTIHLSRTAMEIKSTVGATGEDLAVYLKYTNEFVNKRLDRLLASYVPTSEWTPRSPFKG